MREKLKQLTENDYWVYGLKESDFDYTYELAKEYIKNNQDNLQREIAVQKKRYPDPDILYEIQFDLAHYAWIPHNHIVRDWWERL